MNNGEEHNTRAPQAKTTYREIVKGPAITLVLGLIAAYAAFSVVMDGLFIVDLYFYDLGFDLSTIVNLEPWRTITADMAVWAFVLYKVVSYAR